MCSMNSRQSIPKGSLSCNQLKLEHLRLFFTQLLVRVQFSIHYIVLRNRDMNTPNNVEKCWSNRMSHFSVIFFSYFKILQFLYLSTLMQTCL